MYVCFACVSSSLLLLAVVCFSTKTNLERVLSVAFSRHNHRAVVLMYFENLVRYARYIALNSALFGEALSSFLDQRYRISPCVCCSLALMFCSCVCLS